jgi:hypothetical protein
MKTIFFNLSIFCLCLISCKKERSCNCTVLTQGTTTTHNQAAGISISIPIVGSITLTQPSDTTMMNSYTDNGTKKMNYEKVSKKTMKKTCPSSYEETFNDNSSLITPGSSTVTTTNSGKRSYTCKIE